MRQWQRCYCNAVYVAAKAARIWLLSVSSFHTKRVCFIRFFFNRRKFACMMRAEHIFFACSSCVINQCWADLPSDMYVFGAQALSWRLKHETCVCVYEWVWFLSEINFKYLSKKYKAKIYSLHLAAEDSTSENHAKNFSKLFYEIQ